MAELRLNEGKKTDLRSTEDEEKAYDLGDEAVHPYLFKRYGSEETDVLEAFEVGSYGVELMYRKPHLFTKDLGFWEFVGRLIREM